jgi:hypothetical protein
MILVKHKKLVEGRDGKAGYGFLHEYWECKLKPTPMIR